jgi:transposase-like protein
MKVKRCSLPDFRKKFCTQEDCLLYLSDSKWGLGYHCRKCNHDKYKKGNMYFHRRCTSCGYSESPTAQTIFHSIKIPLVIAFEMAYRISVSKSGISSVELCREYDLNLKTTYNFKRKIQLLMKSSETNPLNGTIHVDEFVFGGEEKGCQGRSSKSEKLKICVAVEIVQDKKGNTTMGRAYAQSIDNYSTIELEKIFETHIDKDAHIVTDKWKGYAPLAKFYDLKQILSNKGGNFPNLHILIMNMKSWMRGTHHHISLNHVQQYLNEFCFRFNRRNWMKNMPIFVLQRIEESSPKPVKLTKGGFYG